MARTALERLESLQKTIKIQYGFWGLSALRQAVGEALDEPPPKGRPDEVNHYADVFRDRGRRCLEAGRYLRERVRDPLPDAWTGSTATSASVAAAALDNGMRRTAETFDEADRALRRFAGSVENAQQVYPDGRARLEYAAHLLKKIDDLFDYDGAAMKEAHHEAMAGIAVMLRCVRQVDQAGHELSRTLSELASRARVGRLGGDRINALDRLVIADAATPGPGPHDANLILAADAASRASVRLDHLDTAERERFTGLLKSARSAPEQAYLMQALAAGYGVTDIEAFDRKIHAHGADPLWLQQHLTPIDEVAGPDRVHSQRPVEFGGRAWTQGPDPTCVAMSTVMARAKVDPLYALQLTTGGHPGDPAYDNGDAFAQRLHDEQHKVYDDGRNWLQDLFGTDGMTDGQARDAANDEVAPHTGAAYEEVRVHSAGDRRGVLLDVEKAVDQGLPVTFSVEGNGEGHEMAIIGHQGGMLEVYNPWGYTVWVSEDDFVNDHMNAVADGVPPNVHAVNVPRQ
jgi:uncharacterized protein YukE